ncbi:efflux RND transporter periplasmic adaptor subunit [Paraburkholderia phenazinium]|jgi:multidrug efflux system membrane fusion protein|uniref:Membrane fusion protein, multidrug efflux system n=1 Tax=Paraburkholderia phenazinium TaxID=60549 RepID=A0A1G8BLJ0_9BURK|nr:efflux RND transporter periplasmic adaptor subunit [Paraburkholderia phenazinium]SDH33963.1 membrane fusion protein, multidrug efflux system [Paraburkholderia phenazinium]
MSEAVSTQPKHSRRRFVLIAVVVLALVALVVVHLLNRPKPARGAAPQVVTVATATLGSMPVTLSELGTVTPTATVTVLPQLSGYLTAVGYHEGQDVEKGQFLAQIDPRQYEIDKQQAEAQLAKDRASLAQARSDLARYTQLNEHKSIAEQTFVDQQFLVQQDEAAVKSDLANIAQFDLDLTYCHITAPVAGRVGLRLVDPGNYVTASSSPGIVVITTMKPTTVQFTVPQDSLASVLQRMNGGASLPVTAFSSDNSKQVATGTLYAVSNQMATSTGTVTLRATFPNDDEALFPNEFVNVKLLVDTMQNAVLVPTPAVQSGAPGDYVYLVNANNTVSVHKVTLGPSDGKNTVITAGLQAGNIVVTDGTDRLSDGAKIQAAKARPASGASAAAADAGTASAASGAHGQHNHAHNGASGATAASAEAAS